MSRSASTSPPAPVVGEFTGLVEGHRDGHGFVRLDGEDGSVYLAPEEMRSVMHGDRVRLRVLRHDRRGRPEGRVLDILERPRRPIIGRLLVEGGAWVVAPEDRRYGQDILVPRGGTGPAQPGQVVVVELTEVPSLHSQPVGRVVEVLGEVDDPGIEIEIAVRKFGVPHLFAPAAQAQAASLPDQVRPADRRGRVDLRDVPLVTIDGEDARDFDDAVYCEPYSQGRGRSLQRGWRLVVAIADVSHYVKPQDAIDLDAYERATSVYFPRRVIPMLPEKLSNGLCSLNPEVERLALACDMVVDEGGQVQAYQFYTAVIRSHARLTYTEVAAILANTRGPQAQQRAGLVEHLVHLHEVYRALLKRREARGAMDFETTETQIVCDEYGRIERIVPRVRTDAHRLIEEAMLSANECAADFITQARHPALYRVHEGPTPEKRMALQDYLRALGLGLQLGDTPSPGDFQAIAAATKDRPDAAQVHQMLLRSMQQAIYTPVNVGHFGLAYPAYAHFTSPIRRYPDLLVHRVIKALVAGKAYGLVRPEVQAPQTLRPATSRRRPALEGAPDKAMLEWEAAGAHTSACERRADEASRDVEAWLKCRYMRDHLGEEYAGSVTAVASFGLFVTLDPLHVEGLVHITELGGEYWRFDEVRQELRGDRSGMRYGVGSRVQVQVSRVDLDARKIDFRLVPEGEGERLLARGRATRTPAAAPVPASATEELAAIGAADRQARAELQRTRRQAGTPARKKPAAGKRAASGKRNARR
ncbi:MAG: ribonuclease [Pseudomonadota bacterium]